MKDSEQKTAAKAFVERWKGKGYEKGESQPFWIDLLEHVLGVENGSTYISFEDQVHLDHTSFIDGYISSTKVLIEQKGLGKDMRKPILQSDGSLLTPFQQAKRYITELPLSQHPRWVVTCNFSEFYVYDMEKPGGEPEQILLENLEKEYYRLQFLVDSGNENLKQETEISIAAGDLVGILYDALLKQYRDPTNPNSLKSLNMLCVRLVFCLYAEDAGVFGKRTMFHDYMARFDARDSRKALIELFRVLDQKENERDAYIDDDLAAFPYVNGGLFSDENIEIPNFTDEIRTIILSKASENFDWSEISPTIFGAVFESTLNPETRRSGGMHYTSIENIHKVIDPLFLDDLKKEFEEIKDIPVVKTRNAKLLAYQEKLASLKFLDPACGSGNFLTETYLSIRHIENQVIYELFAAEKDAVAGQIVFGVAINPIKVSIQQFFGIEINDFAVTVAKTALWIAESQMMKETETIVHMTLDFLPLKTNAYIVEGNALRIDWDSVVSKSELNYIMGNPPFVGQRYISREQHDDIINVLDGWDNSGKVDYVVGWYKKANDYIVGTNIQCALVSTNSITQGEQVGYVWKPLFEAGLIINFAYRTFIWDSEASIKAHVHCVIIGFSRTNRVNKRIYTRGRFSEVGHINGYLVDAEDIFVDRRNTAICDVPQMLTGNRQADGGFLTLSKDEKDELISKEPEAEKYIRRMLGSDEFINKKDLYCLWLVGASPSELRSMPLVLKRVEQCREHRLAGKPDRRRLADTPMMFREQINPDTAIIIPTVSSERRRYVPMGFIDKSIIVNANAQIIENASIYHLGVLTSNVHMAWMRAVCGRLEMRYRYSKDIVYNNFPWPEPSEQQKKRIEETAQLILDARAKYSDCTLADLYDDLTMPPELRKAHSENDKAVLRAYGFIPGTPEYASEAACVATLMKLYQEKVSKKQ